MEREKRRKMEQEQSFDESENSTFNNENVSQELHHVKSFHYLFLTFNTSIITVYSLLTILIVKLN